MPYIQNALTLVIETVAGLYLIAAILRFLLQFFGADFHNPVCQLVVALTRPPLALLRRIIPGFAGVDTASLVLIYMVAMAKTVALLYVSNFPVAFVGASLLALGEICKITIWILIGAVLISVIVSWVAPGSYHPLTRAVHAISEPVSRPIRKLLPVMGGMDFSPILTLLILNVLQQILVAPLIDTGRQLLF